jgi:hypothetical protein
MNSTNDTNAGNSTNAKKAVQAVSIWKVSYQKLVAASPSHRQCLIVSAASGQKAIELVEKVLCFPIYGNFSANNFSSQSLRTLNNLTA